MMIGGIISLVIGLAISLLISYVIRDEGFNSTASLLTLSIGTSVAGVIFGVGFPMTVVGIVLAWVSRPDEGPDGWEDEAEESMP